MSNQIIGEDILMLVWCSKIRGSPKLLQLEWSLWFILSESWIPVLKCEPIHFETFHWISEKLWQKHQRKRQSWVFLLWGLWMSVFHGNLSNSSRDISGVTQETNITTPRSRVLVRLQLNIRAIFDLQKYVRGTRGRFCFLKWHTRLQLYRLLATTLLPAMSQLLLLMH